MCPPPPFGPSTQFLPVLNYSMPPIGCSLWLNDRNAVRNLTCAARARRPSNHGISLPGSRARNQVYLPGSDVYIMSMYAVRSRIYNTSLCTQLPGTSPHHGSSAEHVFSSLHVVQRSGRFQRRPLSRKRRCHTPRPNYRHQQRQKQILQLEIFPVFRHLEEIHHGVGLLVVDFTAHHSP